MRSIAFPDVMMQGILNSSKTQHRILMKVQPKNREHKLGYLSKPKSVAGKFCWIKDNDPFISPPYFKSPYQVGDILAVKETWSPKDQIWADDKPRDMFPHLRSPEDLIYKADCADRGNILWHSSTTMPLWACRFFLEVTKVRAEFVQDISLEDVKAEGIWDLSQHPQRQYRYLWNSLNAKRGYSWDSNPAVWIYEFKRVEGK